MRNRSRQVFLALIALCISVATCNVIASQAPTSSLADETSARGVGLFPPGALDEPNAKWWTHVLQVCSESSLQNGSDEVSAVASFRLVMHSPTGYSTFLVARINIRKDGDALIVVKRVSGDGTMLSDETIHLQQTQVGAFRKAIEDASFWTTPTAGLASPDPKVRDGGTFCIEGLQGSTYHIAWRRTYEKGLVNELARYFVDMAFRR